MPRSNYRILHRHDREFPAWSVVSSFQLYARQQWFRRHPGRPGTFSARFTLMTATLALSDKHPTWRTWYNNKKLGRNWVRRIIFPALYLFARMNEKNMAFLLWRREYDSPSSVNISRHLCLKMIFWVLKNFMFSKQGNWNLFYIFIVCFIILIYSKGVKKIKFT